jgi:hypothetical protein
MNLIMKFSIYTQPSVVNSQFSLNFQFFKKLRFFLIGILLIGISLKIENWKLEIGIVNAQVPPTPVSCGSTINPEFHSLRPYQASPCQSAMEDYAKFCGNNLTLHDTIQETYNGNSEGCTTTTDGKIRCSYSEQVSKPLVIDLSGANLPIMGNTEDVKNSQNSEETLDDAQKVNNYVSWYLSGVNYRAEYGNSKVDANSLVNFSGPINKLMPSIILDAQRIKTIANAGNQNHNQIVVCGESSLGGFGDTFHVGTVTPKECYKGDDTDAQGSVFRLKSANQTLGVGGEDGWNGELSWWNDIANNVTKVANAFANLFPSIPRDIIDKSLGDHWNYKIPPLPWDDGTGKPFKTDAEYIKAYNEWKGKTCIIIPVINKVVCIDNVFVPNKYADLFPYVPLSSTEDLKGGISIDSVSSATNPAIGGVTVQNISFLKQTPATLFFAHMQEADDLANLLQTTFVAKGVNPAGNPTDVSSQTSCSDVEVRTNRGDNLFAKQITGDLHYSASFSCDFEPPSTSNCMANCLAEEKTANESINCESICSSSGAIKYSIQTCTKDIYISLSTTSSTPKIDDIWSRLVAGPESIFKRIFPKTNVVGGLGQIMDIPGSTNITYSAPGISQSQTDLKLPHIGGISEYFLKGIQTMLRPKGYGESISFASGPLAKIDCDKNAPDVSLKNTLGKEEYAALATRWAGGTTGNHALECYNDTVRRAQEAGVNPAFALTIWLKESDASNYNISQVDFGAVSPTPAGFVGQIMEFLSRAKSYTVSDTRCNWSTLPPDKKDNMHVFTWIYRSGRCDPNYPLPDASESEKIPEDYYENLKAAWYLITTCPFPNDPTDTSCP